MRPENAHKAKRLDGLSRSPHQDREEDAPEGASNASSEEAMLIIADECVNPAAYRGILAPELRARLDVMARDYARILTRIDRIAESDAADGEDAATRRRKPSS